MPKTPQPLVSPQALARRNNENAAVERAFQRRLGGRRRRTPAAADRAWREAERAARPVGAVGFYLPELPSSTPPSLPMNRIGQGLEKQRAAVVLPPELEALVLPMCQRRQGNGLRSLLCLDSDGSQLVATLNRNSKL